MARADPLFGRPWALGISRQQFIIVVCLDKQSVQIAQAIQHAARHVTDIRDEAEFFFIIADHETDWVHGIVVNGEAADRGSADLEGLRGFEGFPNATIDAGFLDNFSRCGCGENGNRVLFEENFEAFDVIAVFVSEQDAMERCRLDAEVGEAEIELFRAQSGVDQQTHVAALDHRRISTTATAKNREPHHAARVTAMLAMIKDSLAEREIVEMNFAKLDSIASI